MTMCGLTLLPRKTSADDLLGFDVHERDVIRVAIDDHDHRGRIGNLHVTLSHRCSTGQRSGDTTASFKANFELNINPPMIWLKACLKTDSRHKVTNGFLARSLFQHVRQME